MNELRVHLDGFNRRHADTPMTRRQPSPAPAAVHREPARFDGSVADIARQAAAEIERSILKGKPIALAPVRGEKPGGIKSPRLRLLARQAKQDLARLAEVKRYSQCRLADDQSQLVGEPDQSQHVEG